MVLGVDLREGDLHRNVVLVDCSRIDVVINSRCLIVNLPSLLRSSYPGTAI